MPISDVLIPAGQTGRQEIVCDLDWDSYCELPAMNPSTLVHGIAPDGSMLRLKQTWENPQAIDPEKAPAGPLVWGRALHTLLFEPHLFELRYQCWEGRRAGNAYKNYARDAAECGAEVLNNAQYRSVMAAAMSFSNCAKVKPLVSSGKAEVTLLTVEDGVQLRHRLDWIDGIAGIVDLKTTRSMNHRLFSSDCFRYHYFFKLGMYQRAFQKISGSIVPVTIIVLEKKAPFFDVGVMPVPQAVLDAGVAKGLKLLADLKQCIATDVWPGRDADIELHIPQWEMEEETDYSDLGASYA